MITKLKIFFIFYIFTVIFLFLYSYTQVDLNLTMSQWSIWQVIQKSFQHIGYFQRPLSTAIYSVILVLLSTFYLIFLWFAKKNKISEKQFWLVLILSSVILLFSYNAFSYDLFNYMFDARIFTFHHLDPYQYKALDFPKDPWINFMRWTHRTYPYGITWLGLTIPLSYIGMQFFLPTLFLFKALMVGSFLGTVYFLGKILDKASSPNKLLGLILFAFNPLVVIESLVSSHNDIVMMFLAIFSLYLLLSRKYLFAILILLLSIGIKFATVFLLPIFIIFFLLSIAIKKVDLSSIAVWSVAAMIVPLILVSVRTNFQPWYLMYVLPFAFITRKYYIIIPSIIISIGSLLMYIPFLYLGNWDKPVPEILFGVLISSIAISFLSVVIWGFKTNKVI